jgi:hypothetical protein
MQKIQPEKHFIGPCMETSMPMTKQVLAFALQKNKSAFLLPKRQYKLRK